MTNAGFVRGYVGLAILVAFITLHAMHDDSYDDALVDTYWYYLDPLRQLATALALGALWPLTLAAAFALNLTRNKEQP